MQLPAAINPTSTTLAILAGGQGSRMGQPKSRLVIHDRPILHYLLHRLQWPGPTLLVTAPGNEHPPGHDAFDAEATDPVPGEGPLRGLLTALDHSQTPLLLVTTVDMPLLDHTHLQWLVNQLNRHPDALGVMTQRSTPDGAQLEPFPAAFRASAKQMIRPRLARGIRSLHSLTREPTLRVLVAPADWGDAWWTNLNHPQEFEAFLSKYKGGH